MSLMYLIFWNNQIEKKSYFFNLIIFLCDNAICIIVKLLMLAAMNVLILWNLFQALFNYAHFNKHVFSYKWNDKRLACFKSLLSSRLSCMYKVSRGQPNSHRE